METKLINIQNIVPNEGQIPGLPTNPRQWKKKEMEQLKKSLQETPELFDARGILVVPKDGKFVVLGGNMRLAASKSLGLDEVPCIIFPEDTPVEKLKEIVIKDNGAFGEWDYDLLANEWDDLPLTDWGVPAWETSDDQRDVETEVQEDDFDENEDKVETRCALGDIWLLGDHRLMCGDSTSVDDINKLMDGEKADMVFTDPPYGMKKESEGVLNDNLNYDALLRFNKEWIPITFTFLKGNGSWYCWGMDEPLMDIYSRIIKPMCEKREAMFRNLLTWDKGNGQGQMSEEFRCYPIADEKCLFVMKGSIGFYSLKEFKLPFHKELMDRFHEKGLTLDKATKIFRSFQKESLNESSAYNSSFQHLKEPSMFNFPKLEYWRAWFGSEEGWHDFKERYEKAKVEWRNKFNYFDNTHDNMNNVWHFSRTSKKERELTGGHATPKPLELCQRGIKSSSRIGDIVLDVFGGSGSTMMACEQLGRKCRMMELDPHYCDVIIARWEKLTGKEAVRVE